METPKTHAQLEQEAAEIRKAAGKGADLKELERVNAAAAELIAGSKETDGDEAFDKPVTDEEVNDLFAEFN